MRKIRCLVAFLITVCLLMSITVIASAEGAEGMVTVSADGVQTVTNADNLIIDGAKTTIKLDNAVIGGTGSAVVIKNNSVVTMELIGNSIITGDASTPSCGIYVESGSSLTIKGNGTLKATGGKYGAAIGSYGTTTNLPKAERLKCGDVTIAGGTVYAYGGEKGAGIGSGNHVDGGNITISGGTVYAFGNDGGAGIGSGYGTSGGAAPIAAVGDYDAGHISITGGTVYAAAFQLDFSKFDYMDSSTYDNDSTPDTFAAGIGGGYGASAGDISITGGKIIAVGNCGGAGIGSGRGTSKASKYDEEAFKVRIFIGGSAEIIAVATDDNRSGSQGGGAAVGSGRGTHTGGTIEITGNAKLTAVAPPNTYAIGSGSSKNPVNGLAPVSQRISISDGVTLYAIARGVSAVENSAAEFSCADTIGYDNSLASQTALLGTRKYTVPANTTSIWANKAEAAVTPPASEDEEKVNIRIDTPKKMAVKFGDGTVYYGGEMKEVVVGKEYSFQMCSVNWENGIYDEAGNGICGTVVYRMKAVHEKEFMELRKSALNDPSRYTVKGMDIIDNDSKTIIINCDATDSHLETDVNNFFVAYRFHFQNGDYNKQTGIENVVNTPLESLSVNLPLGTTVKCDAYNNYQIIDSDDIFITRNNGEGQYVDEYLSSVNDYYWNY